MIGDENRFERIETHLHQLSFRAVVRFQVNQTCSGASLLPDFGRQHQQVGITTSIEGTANGLAD